MIIPKSRRTFKEISIAQDIQSGSEPSSRFPREPEVVDAIRHSAKSRQCSLTIYNDKDHRFQMKKETSATRFKSSKMNTLDVSNSNNFDGTYGERATTSQIPMRKPDSKDVNRIN